jgi:hypothetical protein
VSDERPGRFRVIDERNGRELTSGTRDECAEFLEEMGDGVLEELVWHGRDDLTPGHWERVSPLKDF